MTVKANSSKKLARREITQRIGAAFKAGIGGGVALAILSVVNQISPIVLQRFLIPPAFVTVWIVTGIAAAMFAESRIKTPRDGWHIGILAGIISATVSGFLLMILAAFGLTFRNIGEGILTQFSADQLASLANSGVSDQLLVSGGSVIATFAICGIGGMLIAALLGGVGGWLYPKFNK